MEQKNVVATIYLKNGQAVKGREDATPLEDVILLAKRYNDSGIDKIIVLDLSEDDEEHEKNINVIRDINRNVEIKVCAGGNINRFEDIKKLIYAGCLQVIVNGAKPNSMELAEEASKRFGKDRILVSVKNVDFIFKHQKEMDDHFHELLVLDTEVLNAVENITDVPYVVYFEECDYEKIIEVLSRSNVTGIAGTFINDPGTDIMEMKSQLSAA
ncbi:MAG: tRNA-dihydrouridine synthase, partial [Roseburia sp.]|nr:tRNA-dihydrouridine synthase [Roseburia sp.]